MQKGLERRHASRILNRQVAREKQRMRGKALLYLGRHFDLPGRVPDLDQYHRAQLGPVGESLKRRQWNLDAAHRLRLVNSHDLERPLEDLDAVPYLQLV